jgi:hypothetical protein
MLGKSFPFVLGRGMGNGLVNASGLGGGNLLAIRGSDWQCRSHERLVLRTRNQ